MEECYYTPECAEFINQFIGEKRLKGYALSSYVFSFYNILLGLKFISEVDRLSFAQKSTIILSYFFAYIFSLDASTKIPIILFFFFLVHAHFNVWLYHKKASLLPQNSCNGLHFIKHNLQDWPFCNLQVVHNYGHGGYGIATSPGTAKYVVNMLQNLLKSHPSKSIKEIISQVPLNN